MVEVFKTNVILESSAIFILDQIHLEHRSFLANFDLDDRDHILRIDSGNNCILSSQIIELLEKYGFDAEILSDDQNYTHSSENTNAVN